LQILVVPGSGNGENSVILAQTVSPLKPAGKPAKFRSVLKVLKVLGPGLITGASDDDPSGIATYSQAGAAFGLSTLWTALITFPLMAAIQEMCARIGIVTQIGLTGIIRKHYPPVILHTMMLFSFPAVVMNIGADIQGMGAVAHMMWPGINSFVYSIIFTTVLLISIIVFPYRKIAGVLKWLCVTLLLYAIVPFLVHADWTAVLKNTFIPTIKFDRNFFEILVAILGTTISPYLFFWQATMEAEDFAHSKHVMVNKRLLNNMRTDVDFGMFFSNLVMFFIILTTGAVLNKSGVTQIDTVDQAAGALAPLTGKFTSLLFTIGILGTGFLAIPVLAGSLSYILAETFGWSEGLDRKFNEAPGFYITIIVSLGLGLCMEFLGISPIKALLYTAILYGLTAPVMIVVILHICNNNAIMGEHTNSRFANILGYLTLALMTVAAIAMVYFMVKQ